ncbi:MAG: 4'-phosphopantetheinyl transferase superfamily protein [Saprospiraceae bacterium]|nr:4'-phosphopantetheinyl transferase superfamily protein [Saprospiraceae bacterium]
MPTFLATIFPDNIELSIWHITEEQSFFSNHQKWYEQEVEWIDSIHPKKKLEYLASRYLLYNRLQPEGRLPIIKNEFGKLIFKESDSFLSISHSGNYTAYVIGPSEVGLDIQVYDKKIIRILNKFLDPEECEIIKSISSVEEQIKLAILSWCAKEAVYKAHGKRGIQFNKQIKLHFNRSVLESACLYLPLEKIDYKLIYELEKDFVWLLAYHEYRQPMDYEFL